MHKYINNVIKRTWEDVKKKKKKIPRVQASIYISKFIVLSVDSRGRSWYGKEPARSLRYVSVLFVTIVGA